MRHLDLITYAAYTGVLLLNTPRMSPGWSFTFWAIWGAVGVALSIHYATRRKGERQ